MKNDGLRRRIPTLGAALLAAVLAGLAGGCDAWFGETKAKLEGTRISVLEHQQGLTAEAGDQLGEIVLPAPVENPNWPQAGGSADHSMGNLAFGGDPRQAWQVSIGRARGNDPHQPAPVVADGRIFTIDSRHLVRAFSVSDGARIWERDLVENEVDDDATPGGLAVDRGRLFVTTGFGRVIALDVRNGERLWRRKVGYPMHAPPAVSDGRLFIVTVENTLHALSQENGEELWQPFRVVGDIARLVGGATPAVAADLVLAPFSSGELTAVRVDSGRPLWSESLATTRRTDELTSLGQIRALPVVDHGRVYAISQGGQIAAFDARSGQRFWERDIGGVNTPWLAGRFLFLITTQNALAAISADTGRVYWVTQLPSYANEKERSDPIAWVGPVLAGDRLIVASSRGEARIISPYNGKQLGQPQLSGGVQASPIVAGRQVFVVTNDGRLTAFR